MTRLVAGLTVLVVGALMAGWAPAPARAAGEQTAELPQVQLLAFMAPIKKAGKDDPDSAPITVTFEVPEENDVAKVCRMTPRIRDAVNEVLYAYPLVIGSDRKLDLTGLDKRVMTATNRALGQNLVSGVTVEAGAKHMRTGGAKFAGSIGCAQINK